MAGGGGGGGGGGNIKVIDFSLQNKGDLHTFTDKDARLPVGSTPGMFLTTDPTAPSGLKWLTVSPGNDVAAWHRTGDAFGAEAKLGTTDNVDLILVRNGLQCMRFNRDGLALQGGPTLSGCVTTNMDEGIDIPFGARYRGYNEVGDNAMTLVGNGEAGGRPAVVFLGSFENGALFYRNLEVDIYCSDVTDSLIPNKVASFTYFETKFYTQRLGLYGVNAVVRPTITGSRGGNAALADLLTKVALQGLFIDGTTA